MNARPTRFPLFDSLRAIAALSIFATHAYAAHYWTQADSPLRAYALQLVVGVHIFFAISGFLLYRPFVRARLLDGPRPATGAYAWRRFLRITPAYWVALTVTTVWLGTHYVFTGDAPLFYLFGQVYSPTQALGGLPQAWSLCVEVTFYAFLPLYALGMSRLPLRAGRPRLLAELAGVALLVTLAFAYNGVALALGTVDHYGTVPLHLMLPAYLNSFGVGMALAIGSVWLEGRPLPRWLRPIDRFPSLGWGLALIAFVLVSRMIVPGRAVTHPQYLAQALLFSIVALGVVVPGVFGNQRRGVVRRVLANRALLFIGVISYSFFLYHVAVITQLQRWKFAPSSGLAWFVVALVLSLAIATLSYYAIERPAIGLKRLVGGKPEPLPADRAAVAPASATPVG